MNRNKAFPFLLFYSTISKVYKIDYSQKMHEFVIGISQYTKGTKPNFNIIPQNGIRLVIMNGSLDKPNMEYLNAIDGNGQESLFDGYESDVQPKHFQKHRQYNLSN